tara:strand:- start:399 stop:1073 length:675 start_codon:yes stop_codon:yes gene_type:complete
VSDYTKSTNFATKDNLSSGNPLKIVKGTEIDTEFNNIQTAIATKADLSSPAFTGTPTLPTGTSGVTQSYGNSSTALATTAFVQAALQLLYPVGTIYTNATSSTNPATSLGFGTWTAFGAGRVMVGFNSSNALFDTAEETGGSADSIVVSHTHTTTVTDPGHTHGTTSALIAGGSFVAPGGGSFSPGALPTATTGITVANASTGVSGTDTNYQPYITVYMWKRTA